MNLWKLNVKTAHDPGENPKQFCLDNNIMGVGWPVRDLSANPTDQEYLAAAKDRYAIGRKRMPAALNAITTRVQLNDLVWLRDDVNVFHLGRVTGPWKYLSHDGKGDKWDRNDIHNTRTVDWYTVGTVDNIPWAIVKQFSRGTLALIKEARMLEFSKFTFNEKSLAKGETAHSYPISFAGQSSIFSYIGPDDCEDVVTLYLQEELGYRLLPSTCKSSTKGYEFVFVHPTKDHCAVVQVKSGKESLYGSDYDSFARKEGPPIGEGRTHVFLLSTLGSCDTQGRQHVTCIDPAELETWIMKRKELWSGKLRNWVGMMEASSY